MRELADRVDVAIFQRSPQYVRAVVLAQELHNQGPNAAVAERLAAAQEQAHATFAAQPLTTHPHIAVWRAAYKAFGMWDGSSYSAVEALARRARRGAPLRSINPLVDLMNAFSLFHLVPVGGDDVEHIEGHVTLRLANGTETFVPFHNEQTEHPPAEEVIYVDDAGRVLCRKWNWRQGRATAITPQTTCALCNVDVLPPLDREAAGQLVEELARWVRDLLGAQVTTALITADQPLAKFTCHL